ncbi:MAG: class I SAM-dependent methyltransferase [Candidatus Omnitrophica bacterium]|nr:class I SAM-dependent methyltransferase [Candidatus Omnitrophota bacterium]
MDDKKWQKHLGEEPYACGQESVDRPYEEKVALSARVLIFVPSEAKNVLVVGCGDGTEVKWLVDRGFDSRGVTRNQSEVINAKKRYGVDIEVGDMHELPYPDKQFDCLVAKDVFEHAIAPTIALREFYRVLNDYGLLILTMPSMEWADEFYHHSVLTHKQMRIMFEKHSFELLAGPGIKPKIPLKSPIIIPLGLKQGHIDVFIAKKLKYKPADFAIDVQQIQQIPYVRFLKSIYKHCPAPIAKLFRGIYNQLLMFKARFY